MLKQYLWGIASAAMAASCLGGAWAAPKKEKAPLALGLKGTSSYSATQEATKPLKGSPVPNLGVVSPGCVYRSGQPSKAGYEWLKAQGFKSIVCLRKEHDDDAAEMAKYGFHYLYLPIVDETAPTKEQAETFLKFAANPDNWPLVVHCHGGEGRAATMSALVRYSFDGWGMAVALKEARNYRTLAMFRGQLCAPQRKFLDEWVRTHKPGSMRPQVSASAQP